MGHVEPSKKELAFSGITLFQRTHAPIKWLPPSVLVGDLLLFLSSLFFIELFQITMDNGAEKHQTSSDYIHTQSNADLHVDNVKEGADSDSIDRAMSAIEEKGQGKLKRTLKARHLAVSLAE